MLLNWGVAEDSWESLGLQGDPTSPSQRRSVLSVHWKDWCWSWNSNILATSCEELTHWKWLMLGGIRGRRRRGRQRMRWLDGITNSMHMGLEDTPGVGDGQGGLVCCSSWGCKESDTTEWLNWTDKHIVFSYYKNDACTWSTRFWLKVEGITLSEIRQTQKGKYYMISLIYGIYNGQTHKNIE